MRKVIDEFQCGKYRVLILDDSKMTLDNCQKYRIEEKEYTPVSVYDARENVIAIETEESFIGKTVEFI